MQEINTNVSSETLVLLAIGLAALFLFSTLALQTIFNKLYEGGWKAWVPLLNGWTFFSAAGMSGAWVFAVIVPVLGVVAVYMAVYRISVLLGFNGTGMVFLAMFFPHLWLLVVAGSRNKTDAEIEDAERRRGRSNYPSAPPVVNPADSGRAWALAGVPQPAPPVYSQPQPSSEIAFGYGRVAPTQTVQSQPDYANPVRTMPPSQFPAQPPSL